MAKQYIFDYNNKSDMLNLLKDVPIFELDTKVFLQFVDKLKDKTIDYIGISEDGWTFGYTYEKDGTPYTKRTSIKTGCYDKEVYTRYIIFNKNLSKIYASKSDGKIIYKDSDGTILTDLVNSLVQIDGKDYVVDAYKHHDGVDDFAVSIKTDLGEVHIPIIDLIVMKGYEVFLNLT